LPAARLLAGALGARVTLVHVIEVDAPSTIHGERHLSSTQEAEAYLKGIRERAGPEGSEVAYHVHAAATRDIVRSLVAHEDELSPDLIVLCTHGRGGLRRIFIGSIAQQVAAAGTTPVLLIRPDGRAGVSSFTVQTVLAPVDGEPSHEQGLEVALDLARATSARLLLLAVAPTMGSLAGRDATLGKLMPGTTQAILEMAEQNLKSYLAAQVSRLQQPGMLISAELRQGDPSPVIVEAAEKADAGIIVLATHGKSGNEAFWTNSVAARVQSQTKRPLLLVPVKSRDRIKE
jgi:nucleotide-binding universal stress UspA family protein